MLKGNYGHLVLTRKANESIMVGNGLIKFTVVAVRGNKVKIKTDAPREMKIVRSELRRNRSHNPTTA